MSMDVANPYRTVIQVISLIYMGYYTLVDGAGLRCGGEGGIRTPENLSDLHAFQACALSRARPPLRETASMPSGDDCSPDYQASGKIGHPCHAPLFGGD